MNTGLRRKTKNDFEKLTNNGFWRNYGKCEKT